MPPIRVSEKQQAYIVASPNYHAWIDAHDYRVKQTPAQAIPLLDCLAHIQLVGVGYPSGQTALDRVLEYVREEVDSSEIRAAQDRLQFKPLDGRWLFNSTIGRAFTKVWGKKIVLPLDGCYENTGPSRSITFLENFARIWGLPGSDEAFQHAQGLRIPSFSAQMVRELVVTQDLLWMSRFQGTDDGSVPAAPRYQVERELQASVRRRLQEEEQLAASMENADKRGFYQAFEVVNNQCPDERKRRRMYEDVVEMEIEEEMRKRLVYHDGKLANFWLRLIDVLQYMPDLEVFRYESDAPMPRVFAKALAYQCRKLKEVSLNFEQPLVEDERLLHVWNNLYLVDDREVQGERVVEPQKKAAKGKYPAPQIRSSKPKPAKPVQKKPVTPKPATPKPATPKAAEKDTPMPDADDDRSSLNKHPNKRPIPDVLKRIEDLRKTDKLTRQDLRQLKDREGQYIPQKCIEFLTKEEGWASNVSSDSSSDEEMLESEEEEDDVPSSKDTEEAARVKYMIDYFGPKPLLKYDFQTMSKADLLALAKSHRKERNFSGNFEELRKAFLGWQQIEQRQRNDENAFEDLIRNVEVEKFLNVEGMEEIKVKALLYRWNIKRYDAATLLRNEKLEEMRTAVRAWQEEEREIEKTRAVATATSSTPDRGKKTPKKRTTTAATEGDGDVSMRGGALGGTSAVRSTLRDGGNMEQCSLRGGVGSESSRSSKSSYGQPFLHINFNFIPDDELLHLSEKHFGTDHAMQKLRIETANLSAGYRNSLIQKLEKHQASLKLEADKRTKAKYRNAQTVARMPRVYPITANVDTMAELELMALATQQKMYFTDYHAVEMDISPENMVKVKKMVREWLEDQKYNAWPCMDGRQFPSVDMWASEGGHSLEELAVTQATLEVSKELENRTAGAIQLLLESQIDHRYLKDAGVLRDGRMLAPKHLLKRVETWITKGRILDAPQYFEEFKKQVTKWDANREARLLGQTRAATELIAHDKVDRKKMTPGQKLARSFAKASVKDINTQERVAGAFELLWETFPWQPAAKGEYERRYREADPLEKRFPAIDRSDYATMLRGQLEMRSVPWKSEEWLDVDKLRWYFHCKDYTAIKDKQKRKVLHERFELYVPLNRRSPRALRKYGDYMLKWADDDTKADLEGLKDDGEWNTERLRTYLRSGDDDQEGIIDGEDDNEDDVDMAEADESVSADGYWTESDQDYDSDFNLFAEYDPDLSTDNDDDDFDMDSDFNLFAEYDPDLSTDNDDEDLANLGAGEGGSSTIPTQDFSDDDEDVLANTWRKYYDNEPHDPEDDYIDRYYEADKAISERSVDAIKRLADDLIGPVMRRNYWDESKAEWDASKLPQLREYLHNLVKNGIQHPSVLTYSKIKSRMRGGALPGDSSTALQSRRRAAGYNGTGKYMVRDSESLKERPSEFVSQFVASARFKDDLPFPCGTKVEIKIKVKKDENVKKIVESLDPFVSHFHHLSVERVRKAWPMEPTQDPNARQPELEPQTYFCGIQKKPTHSIRQLSIVNGSGALNAYLMSLTRPEAIQKLSLENCTHLETILMPIRRARKALRKFIFRSTESAYAVASTRAYAYYHHYITNLRLVLDFLRVGDFDLDTLELYGNFGDPNKQPFEFSGLSTELFEAIAANRLKIERLWIDNHDLDFNVTELKRILGYCIELRDLGISGRSFTHFDATAENVSELRNAGEPSWAAQESLGHLASHDPGALLRRLNPLALTVLRTGYGPLNDHNDPVGGLDSVGERVFDTRPPVYSLATRVPATLGYDLNAMLRNRRPGSGPFLDDVLPGLRHFAIYHEALADGRRAYEIEAVDNPQQAIDDTGVRVTDELNAPYEWAAGRWTDHYRKFLEQNQNIMRGRFEARDVDPPRCHPMLKELEAEHALVLKLDQAELRREQEFESELREFEVLKNTPPAQWDMFKQAQFDALGSRISGRVSLRKKMIGQIFRHHVLIERLLAVFNNAKRDGQLEFEIWDMLHTDLEREQNFDQAMKTRQEASRAMNDVFEDHCYAAMFERAGRLLEIWNRKMTEHVQWDCIAKRETLWRRQRQELDQIDPANNFDDRSVARLKDLTRRFTFKIKEVDLQLVNWGESLWTEEMVIDEDEEEEDEEEDVEMEDVDDNTGRETALAAFVRQQAAAKAKAQKKAAQEGDWLQQANKLAEKLDTPEFRDRPCADLDPEEVIARFMQGSYELPPGCTLNPHNPRNIETLRRFMDVPEDKEASFLDECREDEKKMNDPLRPLDEMQMDEIHDFCWTHAIELRQDCYDTDGSISTDEALQETIKEAVVAWQEEYKKKTQLPTNAASGKYPWGTDLETLNGQELWEFANQHGIDIENAPDILSSLSEWQIQQAKKGSQTPAESTPNNQEVAKSKKSTQSKKFKPLNSPEKWQRNKEELKNKKETLVARRKTLLDDITSNAEKRWVRFFDERRKLDVDLQAAWGDSYPVGSPDFVPQCATGKPWATNWSGDDYAQLVPRGADSDSYTNFAAFERRKQRARQRKMDMEKDKEREREWVEIMEKEFGYGNSPASGDKTTPQKPDGNGNATSASYQKLLDETAEKVDHMILGGDKNKSNILCHSGRQTIFIDNMRRLLGAPVSGTDVWLPSSIILSYLTLVAWQKNTEAGCGTLSKSNPNEYIFTSPAKYIVLPCDVLNASSKVAPLRLLKKEWNITNVPSDLSNVEVIVIPLYVPGHWMLGAIFPKKKTYCAIDSYHSGGGRQLLDIGIMISYIWGDSYHKDEWNVIRPRSNSQKNNRDCGVFVCWNGELLLNGAPDLSACTEPAMPQKRREIGAKIYLEGKPVPQAEQGNTNPDKRGNKYSDKTVGTTSYSAIDLDDLGPGSAVKVDDTPGARLSKAVGPVDPTMDSETLSNEQVVALWYQIRKADPRQQLGWGATWETDDKNVKILRGNIRRWQNRERNRQHLEDIPKVATPKVEEKPKPKKSPKTETKPKTTDLGHEDDEVKNSKTTTHIDLITPEKKKKPASSSSPIDLTTPENQTKPGNKDTSPKPKPPPRKNSKRGKGANPFGGDGGRSPRPQPPSSDFSGDTPPSSSENSDDDDAIISSQPTIRTSNLSDSAVRLVLQHRAQGITNADDLTDLECLALLTDVDKLTFTDENTGELDIEWLRDELQLVLEFHHPGTTSGYEQGDSDRETSEAMVGATASRKRHSEEREEEPRKRSRTNSPLPASSTGSQISSQISPRTIPIRGRRKERGGSSKRIVSAEIKARASSVGFSAEISPPRKDGEELQVVITEKRQSGGERKGCVVL